MFICSVTYYRKFFWLLKSWVCLSTDNFERHFRGTGWRPNVIPFLQVEHEHHYAEHEPADHYKWKHETSDCDEYDGVNRYAERRRRRACHTHTLCVPLIVAVTTWLQCCRRSGRSSRRSGILLILAVATLVQCCRRSGRSSRRSGILLIFAVTTWVQCCRRSCRSKLISGRISQRSGRINRRSARISCRSGRISRRSTWGSWFWKRAAWKKRTVCSCKKKDTVHLENCTCTVLYYIVALFCRDVKRYRSIFWHWYCTLSHHLLSNAKAWLVWQVTASHIDISPNATYAITK